MKEGRVSICHLQARISSVLRRHPQGRSSLFVGDEHIGAPRYKDLRSRAPEGFDPPSLDERDVVWETKQEGQGTGGREVHLKGLLVSAGACNPNRRVALLLVH